MSTEIKIVQFDETLQKGFHDFAKLVHPKEKGLRERLQWYTFDNPLAQGNSLLPGLAVICGSEVIGQFLMSPLEFFIRGKKYTGYFGYDFFVKEEYRLRGAGALLFVQGVRMYKPFIGVGITQVVERISKAAGIQTIGQLKKFIWAKNPLHLGGQLLRKKLTRGSPESGKILSAEVFPDEVESSGIKFERTDAVPAELGSCCSGEVLEPARSKEFLQWRYGNCPRTYHVYVQPDSSSPLYLVVRRAVYQGMKLLLIVDYRFPEDQWDKLDVILRAAKEIAARTQLDGVVMASTLASVEDALNREHFMAVGRPSSVIAYLPNEEFTPVVKSIFLTMGDADLDFSFGEDV